LDNGIVPDRYQDRTIFSGEINGEAAMIFCSEFGRDALCRYGTFVSIDGTFKVSVTDLHFLRIFFS
jgi:hypothetical protein